MAGGIWTSENKTIPGVYINVKSQPSVTANIGDKGIVAIAKALSWGPVGEVMEITPGTDVTPYIGYDISTEQAQFLREMMKGSDVTSGPMKILLWRAQGAGGVAATATNGGLTATAKYVGVRGNDIAVAVIADPDAEGTFIVETIVGGAVVDNQSVTAISGLVNNAWVNFSGSGALSAAAAKSLSGGVDPTASATDDAAFMTALEAYDFDIVAYDGAAPTVIDAYVAFVKRLNESVGRKCQMVAANITAANTKYAISVQNGVKLADGSELTANQAVWWVAGAEAGAMYYQSLTYAQYPGAISANPKLTDEQAASAVSAGQIAFIDTFGVVKVCSDINTKTTVTPTEGAEFKKNRVMRVVMQLCNDIYEHFSNYFIGKVDNNDPGRNLLRGWIVGYCNEMMANNGIQNFTAEDVTVLPGAEIDAVVININIQPVDAIEKIYVTVTVTANGATIAVA
jgi:hypothetical protein